MRLPPSSRWGWHELPISDPHGISKDMHQNMDAVLPPPDIGSAGVMENGKRGCSTGAPSVPSPHQKA